MLLVRTVLTVIEPLLRALLRFNDFHVVNRRNTSSLWHRSLLLYTHLSFYLLFGS